MQKEGARIPWFVKKDIDGFFGLGLDNLIQFILIGSLCGGLLGMPRELVLGRIFPGAALSILFGNLFYAWQARKLALRTGRTDVTALPYGINTVSLLAFVFFIMVPVYNETHDSGLAWEIGMLACFLSGVIEFLGAFVAERVRRLTPRAALLSALGGIAITFISMDFLFKIYQKPFVAMLPMAIIIVQYFSKIRFPVGIPGGLLAVGVGTALYWVIGPQETTWSHPGATAQEVGLYVPHFTGHVLWRWVHSEYAARYLSIIVPMALLNVVGSLQNIESAEAGGDTYRTFPSLAVNGLGAVVASLFGSCFPTTIYIGHPGWKAMGARSGYSLINGAFIGLISFTGMVSLVIRAIPLEAGIGILLWIGVVICAQAFQTTPARHAPAVAMGFFPSLAAWGTLMMENGLRAAGSSFYAIESSQAGAPFALGGMLALNQGFLFTSMILAAMAVCLIEKEFLKAALWALVAAACSFVGIIHAYTVTPEGIMPHLGVGSAWPFASSYVLFSVLFLAIHLGRLHQEGA